MQYRDLDIFDDCTLPLPDEEETDRLCERWYNEGVEAQNPIVITGRVNSVSNPYMREYTATRMHYFIEKKAAFDIWDEYRLSQAAMEMIEDDLRRIIKRAHNEQTWEEMDEIRTELRSRKTVSDERISRLEDNVLENHQAIMEEITLIREELELMKQKLETNGSEQAPSPSAFLWPLYTEKATDEAKKTFEDYLQHLCKSNSRSVTSDIKKYLKMKAEAELIIRPTIKEEYYIIVLFGYKKQPKTYYN